MATEDIILIDSGDAVRGSVPGGQPESADGRDHEAEASERPVSADHYIASEGPYDDVYFYFYPYGLLY